MRRSTWASTSWEVALGSKGELLAESNQPRAIAAPGQAARSARLRGGC
jgi:hypothetical protein